MATRNLARTVVEGGRAGYSKLERKARNRRERRLRFDAEGNLVSSRERRTEWGRGFADRLAPLERWIDRHVGRGWNKVYREFCERFDRRTTKGWHLEDHFLDMVGRDRCSSGAKFLVDDRGILRRRSPWRFRIVDKSWQETPRALAWAAGRQVILHGEALFWTARIVDALAPTSPQGRRLTPEEVDFWSSLSQEARQTLTYDPKANRMRFRTFMAHTPV